MGIFPDVIGELFKQYSVKDKMSRIINLYSWKVDLKGHCVQPSAKAENPQVKNA